MSTEQMRQCDRCGTITPHEVVTNKGIAALLCHSCLMRLANQPQLGERHSDPGGNFSGRRVSWKHKPAIR